MTKLIAPFHSGEPEKAQIDVHEADPLYKEVRVPNELTDGDGNKARLKPGAELDVIIEATDDATTTEPAEPKPRPASTEWPHPPKR